MIVGAIVALLAAIGVVAIIGADRGSNSTAPTSGSSSSTTSAATSSSSTVAPPPVEQTLEKVTGLAIGTVTSTSAEVSWQPVRGADGYRVAVIDRDTGQQSPLPDATNGSTSATANDLQPGRRYRFTVRAYASNANDGAESTIRFETPGAGSESAPTPTFAVAATGPTSVHLHIDPVEGATEYTVEYVPDNGLMRSQTLRLGADETEKDLTDLLFLPQSSYTFTVTLTVGTTTSDPVTHPVGPFGSAVPPDGGPQGSTTTGQ